MRIPARWDVKELERKLYIAPSNPSSEKKYRQYALNDSSAQNGTPRFYSIESDT